MPEYYFTEKGYQKIQDEIERLEKYIKQDIAKEIAKAREYGDLRENAEYAAAKEKQAMHMAKLGQLQQKLAGAQIIRKEELPADVVTLGKRVQVKDLDSGDQREYTILGDGETDVDKGIISYEAPIAAALLTHQKGDVVEVRLPVGLKRLEILSVDFFDDE